MPHPLLFFVPRSKIPYCKSIICTTPPRHQKELNFEYFFITSSTQKFSSSKTLLLSEILMLSTEPKPLKPI